jgi:prevent-host-death family protein
MTMLMVNIADIKAKLSEYLDAVARGERVIICNRNRPVAELRAAEPARIGPRDLTPIFPDWKVDPAFFDPLDESEIAAWERSSDVGFRGAAERQSADGPATKPHRKRR